MTITPIATKLLNSMGTTAFGVNSGKLSSATSPINKTNEDTLTSFSPEENKEDNLKSEQEEINRLYVLINAKSIEIAMLQNQLGLMKDSSDIDGVNSKIKSLNQEIDGLFLDIINKTTTASVAQNNKTESVSAPSATGNVRTSNDGSLGSGIINAANKYMGYNESNGSYLKFTEGRAEAWCADFVTYVVKEAYAAAGKQVPANFGSPAVATLMNWGQANGRWIDTSNLGSVKPGDIMIQQHGGRSHTGIVVSVNGDGTVTTIEGNTSDMVAQRVQSLGNITGFVSIA